MAGEQPGFFDTMIGGGVDEQKLADMQAAEDVKQGSRLSRMMFGLGKGAATNLGIAGGQLIGKGQQARDNVAAGAAGMPVEDVRARRRIRSELAKAGVTDDGTFEARRKMAQMAAKIANEEGASKTLASALESVTRVDAEEAEWQKLQAETKTKQSEAAQADIVTAYDAKGDPTTGTFGMNNGQPGLWVPVDGELIHKPYGADFTEVDPTKKTTFGSASGFGRIADIGAFIKKNRGTSFKTRIDGLASSANTSLVKTDRVLSTLTDLYNEGGVGSVIGTSGTIITAVDNLARNVNGVISAFSARGAAEDNRPGLTADGQERTFEGRQGLAKLAQEAGNGFSDLIKLPEGVTKTSAAAQQHRAAVMEMAYMAARLAEPSNRGLSDNDIKNALARIAGDTSNPQVMMRRFLEMQLDAAEELDFELSKVHGSLGPDVTNEEINMALIGEGYAKYKERKDKLFEKFDVAPTGDGRVIFGEGSIIGEDVAPGEGTGITPQTEEQTEEKDLSEMSNDEAASALGL